MFMAQIVVTVSRVYTHLQTHQVVHIKYERRFVCQSDLNEVIYKVHMKLPQFPVAVCFRVWT